MSLVSIDAQMASLLSRRQRRECIHRLEEELSKFEQIEQDVTHHFSERVYAREMRLKKDELIVGKIHKYRSLNILLSGEATVLSVDGVMKIQAPYTFVSDPGAKRVIYAHTDVAWMTIHGTSETDLGKIEDEFIAKDYSEVVV
jgi:hypothetical protein